MSAAPPKNSRPRLRVADHVRSCFIGDQVVLLDLKRNRYLGLDGCRWRAVVASTSPERGDAEPPEGNSSSIQALLAALHRKQILTPGLARQVTPHPLPSPATSIDVRHGTIKCSVRLVHLCRFAAATGLAALWLRFRSLYSITHSIEDRHRRCGPCDADRAARLTSLIAVFDRLRPLAFTSKEKCLFDSLALTIFLAHQGVAVHWVIGVATRPFSAHSWVQDGTEVLNDLHERVRRFTPLLVV